MALEGLEDVRASSFSHGGGYGVGYEEWELRQKMKKGES